MATLLIKDKSVRRCAFAVRAFNVEVAHVREVTSNDLIAQMRFQFWRDVVDDMFGKRQQSSHYSNHFVASELYMARLSCNHSIRS